MRAPLPPDALEALLSSCREDPTLDRVRDLVDRPDPPIQGLLAEPWALPWLERLLDQDPVLAESGASPGSEWGPGPDPGSIAPASPEASFFAQSLLFALSHHPDTAAARRVAGVFLTHPSEAVRIAACRTLERWGRAEHEPWLREGLGDASGNVRRRALRALMARDPATAFDRLDARGAAEASDVPRLRDLLHVVGRDADRRFAFERVGLREADPRWLELALSLSRSPDRELRADAEYALLHAPKDALEAARDRLAASRPPAKRRTRGS